jgi:hypothetical protein
MPVAKYQNIMDNGRAMMYLTFSVKLRSRNKLPMKPKVSDNAFRINSLR